MPMKNPPHPGHSIKDACLDPLGLTVTEAAKVLGVARHTLSRVLNGQAGLSPEMAIRLEKAGWSNADHWLRLQTAYDLAQARRHESSIKAQRARCAPPNGQEPIAPRSVLRVFLRSQALRTAPHCVKRLSADRGKRVPFSQGGKQPPNVDSTR